jgi:predicted DNA-binding transcriptional regulator YafY
VLQTSARLLRLLSLLQARTFWIGADLTSRLEVTDRTLRRDVDRLRTLGYPVDSTSGPAGGYALAAGARLPPIMLDDDEGIAVALALTNASGTTLSSGDAALRALAKLEKVLPSRLRKRLAALRGSIVRVADSGPKIDLQLVSQLASACSERVRVHFSYRDHTGAATARIVEPQQVAHVERRWYLVAWDTAREDWRTFRLDRMVDVTNGATFLARSGPDDDMTTYITRSLSTAGYKHRARVVFHAPHSVIAARIPARYGTVTAIDDVSCRLETGASSLDGVAMWVAHQGVPFVVEAPVELADYLRVLATRLQEASRATSRKARGSDGAREKASTTSSRRSRSR